MLKWTPRVPGEIFPWRALRLFDTDTMTPPRAVRDSLLRRPLDLLVAGVGLVLVAPLLLIFALAVKFHDGGPVFYRARRIGRGGQEFRLYKFRSMVLNADRLGPAITTGTDPRITPVGRFLRRTKLDELPQLFNVLAGDMSLVGPRPEDPRYVALYTDEHRKVLLARPGITSAASVIYRHEDRLLTGGDPETQYIERVMPAKLLIDLDYLYRRTLSSDLGLILRTVAAMFQVAPVGKAPADRLARGVLDLRNRHLFFIDLLLFAVTPLLAVSLRVDATTQVSYFTTSLVVATLSFIAVKILVFYRSGVYTHFWRYASAGEFAHLTLAGVAVTVVQTAAFLLLLRPLGWVSDDFPRSLPLIDGLLTILLVGGIRASVPLAARHQAHRARTPGGERVIVVGAGEVGTAIVKELQSNPRLGLVPVGFVDDDARKQRTRIRGVPVLGPCLCLADALTEHRAGQVIIAMPNAPGALIREVVNICEGTGVRPRIIPSLPELLDGNALRALREVDIADLLRREAVQTDIQAVHKLVRGKRVLITGGGGSIGSELARQVLRGKPATLILLGHGENSLFEITNELRRTETTLPDYVPGQSSVLRTILADIRFPERMRAIFADTRPEIVFHAAAHKHVPMIEENPGEAITNNVWGTRNVLEAALAVDVEHFVMLSTDKAVNPTSVMGASKRAAELLVHQAAQRSGKPYVAVRFGNVLGSRGSVLHTFKRQIAGGGPITVTHPDMKRFFMTIPEAVQLVLQAAVLGKGGEVFVLDMGEPIRLVDMARDLITLSGLEVGRDIKIEFSGIRPGEKLYEELFVPGEAYARTAHGKIFIATHATHDVPAGLESWILALEAAVWRDDQTAIRTALGGLIPEYAPADSAPAPANLVESAPAEALLPVA